MPPRKRIDAQVPLLQMSPLAVHVPPQQGCPRPPQAVQVPEAHTNPVPQAVVRIVDRHALAAEQGNLYAAYPAERFSHFRKTNGYANAPLDGIWLRGPYLHNGSVPTVRALLDPAAQRPKVFYRGNDVIDQRRLGFVSDLPEENGTAFFRYETQCVGSDCAPPKSANPTVCEPNHWAGNGNSGHEGRAYGTELAPEEKDAIVEYLKTF